MSVVGLKFILMIMLPIVVVVAFAILYGALRWQTVTRRWHDKMAALRLTNGPHIYSPHDLNSLPDPVRRYFRKVLVEGQLMVSGATVAHAGTFNMSAKAERWKPFTSNHRVIVERPGFVWDARIRVLPGLPVFVHDAYVAGHGILTAKLLGLLTLAEQPDSPELAHGELMRFLAEAVWYPTALLPAQGVLWKAIGDSSARASLTDGRTTVALEFHFDERGLISSVRSPDRHRLVDGHLLATPWQARFWDYERRDGLLVPLEGEVAWLPETGPLPYWRGRIQMIEYEYAR